jgi:microcystin degradation protein MlrC
MSVRIALGGIIHETNTYCPGQTPLEDFEIARGEEIVAENKGYRTFAGGMMDAAEAIGAEIVPVLTAVTSPSGTIARDVYESLREELLQGIANDGAIDAVALTLHGAGVADGYDDLEGDLCARVRAFIGPDTPLVISLDIHSNITAEMAEAVDCMFGDNFYPEIDGYERGKEAVSAIPRLLSGEWKPVIHVEKLPMLLPTTTTNHGPGAEVQARMWELEKRDGVIDVTFFHAFPYTDIPQVGSSVVVTTNGDRGLAVSTAKELASWIWERREDFRPEGLTPEEAIARAMAIEGGPVVINETSDNPGGGNLGEGTFVLRAMLEAGVTDACIGVVHDPEVLEAAYAAGVGENIHASLGAKHDDFHGTPIEGDFYVKGLTDGDVFLPAWGFREEFGKLARLQIAGIDVVVGGKRIQVVDPAVFLLNGIDVSRCKLVVVKSSQHFRAGFEPIAKAIVTADCPGYTTLVMSYFERHRAPGPMWPLDPNATYES